MLTFCVLQIRSRLSLESYLCRSKERRKKLFYIEIVQPDGKGTAIPKINMPSLSFNESCT